MQITIKKLEKFGLNFIPETNVLKRIFKSTEQMSSFLKKNSTQIIEILEESGISILSVQHRSFPDKAILSIEFNKI